MTKRAPPRPIRPCERLTATAVWRSDPQAPARSASGGTGPHPRYSLDSRAGAGARRAWFSATSGENATPRESAT